jgi:molybdenum cofactor cytidylyltransferase
MAEDQNIHIAGVILAAGSSSRMGVANKLLMKYKSHSVIEEVIKHMAESMLDEIVIITGYESDIIDKRIKLYRSDKVTTIYNPDYQKGRAESIKKAVRYFDKCADALLFMVADKPGVDSALINRAILEYKKHQPRLLYVETPDGRGHPIIFSSRLFGELLMLEGDRVGDNLIAKYTNDTFVLVDDAVQIDINNEEDYRRLLEIGGDKRIT